MMPVPAVDLRRRQAQSGDVPADRFEIRRLSPERDDRLVPRTLDMDAAVAHHESHDLAEIRERRRAVTQRNESAVFQKREDLAQSVSSLPLPDLEELLLDIGFGNEDVIGRRLVRHTFERGDRNPVPRIERADPHHSRGRPERMIGRRRNRVVRFRRELENLRLRLSSEPKLDRRGLGCGSGETKTRQLRIGPLAAARSDRPETA